MSAETVGTSTTSEPPSPILPDLPPLPPPPPSGAPVPVWIPKLPPGPPPERESFLDFRELIKTMDRPRNEQSLEGRFISALRELRETPMGKDALDVIERCNRIIHVVLNREGLNEVRNQGRELFIDPTKSDYMVVSRDGLRCLEKTTLIIMIYHEIVHILHYLEDVAKTSRNIERTEGLPFIEFNNWEEFYTICGAGPDQPSENLLRKYLRVANRVGHQGREVPIDRSESPHIVLTNLASLDLTGDLASYLAEQKITVEDVLHSGLIFACFERGYRTFFDMILEALERNYPGQDVKALLVEKAIENFQPEVVIILIRTNTVEKTVQIGPARESIFLYALKRFSGNPSSMEPYCHLLGEESVTVGLLEHCFDQGYISVFLHLIALYPHALSRRNRAGNTIEDVLREREVESANIFLDVLTRLQSVEPRVFLALQKQFSPIVKRVILSKYDEFVFLALEHLGTSTLRLEALFDLGFDFTALNRDGKTVLEVCFEKEYDFLFELILQKFSGEFLRLKNRERKTIKEVILASDLPHKDRYLDMFQSCMEIHEKAAAC